MSKLTQEGIVTPIGSVSPDFLSQHYIDTVANKAYVSFGLGNSDWQEIGSGGGGGGGGGPFGQITATLATKGFNDDGGLETWNIDADGPLLLKLDTLNTFDLNVDIGTPVPGTTVISNRLIVMLGQPDSAPDITLTIAGNNNELFIDPVTGTGTSTFPALVGNDEVYIFDVFYTVQDIDVNIGNGSTVFMTQIAKFNFGVS